MSSAFVDRLLAQCSEAEANKSLIWNRRDEQRHLWEKRGPKTTLQRLGTGEEARAKIRQCESILFEKQMECAPLLCLIDTIRSELDHFDDTTIVGDPADVSYRGKCLRIGYVIEYDMISGLRRDVFETHTETVSIFMTDRALWVSSTSIVRSESEQ